MSVPSNATVSVNVYSATKSLRDLAVLLECGSHEFVALALRGLADRYEVMYRDQTPTSGDSIWWIEHKAAAWDKIMKMWDDPDNEEDLNGGDLIELIGQLRLGMGAFDG